MASVSEWGQETTGTEVAERFKDSIRNKNEQIAKESPDVKLHLVELDLSSQVATRQAAEAVSKVVDHVDILINNAGVVTSERRETAEGIELQFGTNHVGHFLLTSLLTPLLLAAAEQSGQPGAIRVVNVTSLGYRLSPIRFHDYNFEGKAVPTEEEPPAGIPSHMKPDPAAGRNYHPFSSYGQSKTANILHAVALNDRLGSKGVRAFAVHPGSIWTDLSRNLSPDDLKVVEGTSGFWKDQDQGVATILVAALDPALSDTDGRVLLSDCQLVDVAASAKSPAIAEQLWQLSEKLTGEHSKL
ncbi:hypothetical protein LTR65_009776 [Meristemomyces frigidus]